MNTTASMTIFIGEDYQTCDQAGPCFTDEHDRDLMAQSESSASERFAAACAAIGRRAITAAGFEQEAEITLAGAMFLSIFMGGTK